MTSRRRAGAPRLIDWTGERCVPWAPDVQVVYEHLHRYLWAARLTKGRRVLDLASGEGFGAAILAETAASVVGMDIDKRTVDHSSLNYGSDQIDFRLGDAQDLSQFEDDSFDAVVAFEMIEHVPEQERVLEEVARVLTPDGLLVMSTPDRRAYSDASSVVNPFHVKELDQSEFATLLRGHFEHVAAWGQRTITGSAVSALDPLGLTEPPAARTFFVERQGEDWTVASGLSPMYLVAVASRAPLPEISRDSILADGGVALLRAVERRANEAIAEAQRSGSEAAQESERQLSELRRRVSERDVEVDMRRQRMAELKTAAEEDRRSIDELQTELSAARALNADIEQSVGWRVFTRVRERGLGAIGGKGSFPARILRRASVELTRRSRGREEPGSLESRSAPAIELPEFPDPHVSIIVPLYSGAHLTRACLESIRDNTTKVPYEVILVDDTADAATKSLLEVVRGARVLVNESNLGYLRSVNRGAAAARGDWLVLCNNDIQVMEGWLQEMLDCARSSPDVAVVTPKYLDPDLSLSEAGGIIWRDGTGVNYGRGDGPAECRYEFRREVDYGSAAALLVKPEFWREIGGYDERFAPMYYEDTDICFQAREHGLKVMFEPRANVIHFEGSTAGTDVSTGFKRYQEINRGKFVDKWGPQLEKQLTSSPANVRRASDRHRGTHVLIVDHRVPMWDRDSGSLRMRGMIRALIDLGCRVTLFPDDRHLVLPYTVDLMRMGVEVWYGDIDIAGALDAIGPGLGLVITCRPHASSRWLDAIRARAPSTPIVYDTVDLHWLREVRRAGGAGDDALPLRGSQASALREIELALIRATDATLTVTEEERARVEADVPDALVRVLPNVHELKAHVPAAVGRKGVLFIGGFEHTPNIDAAERLVNRVMPLVWRELSDVPVAIVGGSVPPEIEALASPLVDVTGWVPDVEPLLDSVGAMVAPLSYGAGLKGKVTQALAAGVPVVTTPVGAEGLDAVDGQQLLIGGDDEALAEHVVRVLTDASLWTSLSRAGQELVAERCSPAVLSERMKELLDRSVYSRPPEQSPDEEAAQESGAVRWIHRDPPPSG